MLPRGAATRVLSVTAIGTLAAGEYGRSVLGGVMANDVIKLVSGKGSLGVDRMFCYSVVDDAGWTL